MHTGTINHSAEGSSWTKKNHKYIRKEGNRYIYPEDLQKETGKRTARDIISEKGIYRTEKNKNGDRTYSYNMNNDTWARRRDAKTGKLKSAPLKTTIRPAREIVSEGKNQRANSYNSTRLRNEDAKAVERARLNAEVYNQKKQKLRNETLSNNRNKKLLKDEQKILAKSPEEKRTINKYRNFGSNAMPSDARNKQYQHAHPENSTKTKENIKKSKENLYKSSVIPYRERSGNPSRVEYTTDANGNTRRKVTSKNEEGVKSTSNSVVQRSKTARDIISDKGVKRVSYNDVGKDRIKTTMYNDNTKTQEKVDKNAGRPDTRNILQKKISEIGRKLGIYDKSYKGIIESSNARKKANKEREKELKKQAKEEAKRKKQAERERDKALPASMRRKRNIKRGKKAVSNFLDKATGRRNTEDGDKTMPEKQQKYQKERYVDKDGNTHIPMNESYVYDKKNKRYVRTN